MYSEVIREIPVAHDELDKSAAAASTPDDEANKIQISDGKEMPVDNEKCAEEKQEIPVDIIRSTEEQLTTGAAQKKAAAIETTDIERERNDNPMDIDAVENSKFAELVNDNDRNEISKSPEDAHEGRETQRFFYDWNATPKLLCAATAEYKENDNFTKGCKWSPDGTCVMIPADDFRIRIYELPHELYGGKIPEELPMTDLKPALSVREGGLVYDSCWYPLMNSWEPATCCFLSTSRESPLHLWDAFTGELRATYRPYNQVDEVEAAISVQFIDSGREVWCGFKGALRSFDTERPGRQKDTISLKNQFPNVSGLVSCIRENPIMPGLIAFGTYSKCIGLYKDGPLCSLKTDSGVTQIEFSPCGTKLYTAVRRNNEFLCWDLRNPGIVLYSLQDRQANTNQRIQFSLSADGSEIVSGGTDGFVRVWKPLETTSDEEHVRPLSTIRLSTDCINGVDMHKNLPILVTSSGQRICDDDDEDDELRRDNSVRLWHFQNQ